MPSMVLIPFADTRSRIHRFSLGSQNRRRWMLGFHRRDARTCECDTDLPKPGRRPVTWQRADMHYSLSTMTPMFVLCAGHGTVGSG